MKKVKKLLVVMLCLMLMQVPGAAQSWTGIGVETVQAATAKPVLKTINGKVYCYENGKKVCGAWRTIGKYKYYFTKSGYAYQADKIMGKHRIVIKKISGKYYGFDVNARMVTGLRMASTSVIKPLRMYYFNTKTGAYDSKTTAKYIKAGKTGQNAATLRKYLGKPKKTVVSKSDSCFMDGNGKDVFLYYDHVVVNVFRPTGSSREIVESVTIRMD